MPRSDEAMRTAGALEIRGPRAVGKTESARRIAASELRLDAADPRALLAREQPASALEGETPRLLDEWQLVPELWNEVRRAVDSRRTPGQFVLSGSAMPEEDPFRHSGAGRFRRAQMRTMTLFETEESIGAVSIAQLLRGERPGLADSDIPLPDVINRIVTGGWPGWLGLPEAAARRRAVDYIDDISTHEFVQLVGTRRNPRRFTAYARALAALIAQPAPYTAITRRIDDASSPAAATVAELHGIAERIYLVEDQPAWAPRLRSHTAAAQTAKRHLADPSLAAALLGAGTDRLLAEPETLGFLFESQVVHDLRVYAQAAEARGVFHYRDTKGRDEIDVVVEGEDGEWLAIEVKLGRSAVDRAAENLLRVSAKFQRPPIAQIVIVPTGVSHVRSDGVFVVPLTVLGP